MRTTRIAIDLPSKVAMSNRQYAALKLFTENPDQPLTIDMAINVDQRSLGSLFYRGWITYDRHGFRLTSAGLAAKERFDHTVIIRDHPSQAFSHYMNNVRVLADYRTHIPRNGKGN